jgi:hypothetical protein
MKFTPKLVAGLGLGVLMLGVPAVTVSQAPAMAQRAVQGNFGNLIAALNNINVQIQRLEALNDLTVEDVRVVNVEDILNNSLNKNNVEILNNVLNNNETEILTLRESLNDNQIIQDVLNNNNVAVNDVVAIDVLSGGDVVVFYQK